MVCLQTNVLIIARYEAESYRLWSCNIIPYISVTMGYTAVWISVGIAVERVLIECFNLSLFGSRLRASFTSLGCFFIAAISNLPAIFARHYSPDPSGKLICIYNYDLNPTWSYFDTSFSSVTIIIPCLIHLICSACILTTIARRKILIHRTNRSNSRLYRVWVKQLYLHRDFLIPPLCLITCLFPHSIYGHTLIKCIPYSALTEVRLHISFTFLLHAPYILAYIVYVYPSDIYRREFQQTWIYRIVCFRKQKEDQLERRRRASSAATIQQLIDHVDTRNRLTFDHSISYA